MRNRGWSNILVNNGVKGRSNGAFGSESALIQRIRCLSTKSENETKDAENENSEQEPTVEEVIENARKLTLPDDGPAKSVLLKWYKTVGDEINAGEEVCEIGTSDFDYDFVSPKNGIIATVLTPEGTMNLDQGEILGYLGRDKEEAAIISAYFADKAAAEKSDAEIEQGEEVSSSAANEEQVECPQAVEQFLESIDMIRYKDVFEKEGFDTESAIRTLTKVDLEEMEIPKGHQRVILTGLEAYRSSK